MGFTYIVTISDINPNLSNGGNKLQYRFPSRRKAFKFMDDAMSRGFVVTVFRENVYPEDEYYGR